MKIKTRNKDLAKALGASRTIHLEGSRGHGPLGWLSLQKELQDRLVSQGGRPSDPHWDTRRLVPFRRDTWRKLRQEADVLSAHGRKVGPAQLAAILIERQITTGSSAHP